MKMRLDARWIGNGPYELISTDVYADGTEGPKALVMSSPHRENVVAHMDKLVADFPYYVIGAYPREHDGISGPCHGEPGAAHRACSGYAEGFHGQIAHPCQCPCHPRPFTAEFHAWTKLARPAVGDDVTLRVLANDHITRTGYTVVAVTDGGTAATLLRLDGGAWHVGLDPRTGLFVDTAGQYAEFATPTGPRPGDNDPLLHGTAQVYTSGRGHTGGWTVTGVSKSGHTVTLVRKGETVTCRRRKADGIYLTSTVIKERVLFNR